jgi:type III pantothenate kinase
MKLLIDLGNTRVKWALWDGRELRDADATMHGDFTDAVWRAVPLVESVWMASVASSALNAQVTQAAQQRFGTQVRGVHSRAQACGVRSAYAQPERLGVDRFLALVAAHASAREATVIASCGTALTLDALAADGTHLGGLIAASPDLALTALRGGAANLGAAPVGAVVEIADNTADAMESGAWLAAAALIERFVGAATNRLKAFPRLILTGGGAQRLGDLLAPLPRIEPDLVLRGLAVLADCGG